MTYHSGRHFLQLPGPTEPVQAFDRMVEAARSLADSLGVNQMPFVMALAYGASASFLTPYGYTTNLMVQNLGGYQFGDYTRAGLPVSIVYSALVILLIPRIFPF